MNMAYMSQASMAAAVVGEPKKSPFCPVFGRYSSISTSSPRPKVETAESRKERQSATPEPFFWKYMGNK